MKTIKGALKKIQTWTKNSNVEQLYLIGLKHYEPVKIELISTGDEESVHIDIISLYRIGRKLKNLHQIDSVIMVHNHPIDEVPVFTGYPSIRDMRTSSKIKTIINEIGLFYDGDYVVSPDEIYRYGQNYDEIKSITPINLINSEDFVMAIGNYPIETGIHILNIAERLYQKIPKSINEL